MNDSIVLVEDLEKVYPGGVHALTGINFSAGRGEIFGLLGPNGAGKSTTIGILTTIVRPTRGRAVVSGHDVVRDALAVRQSIGVVFQDSVLDNEFSGLDNLRLHARLWRVPSREAEQRIASLAELIGLGDRIRDGVRTYSGGMRRRLEIARALLAHPAVLFLDEPTSGLDPAVREEIWDLVMQLRASEGVTIILSTHYLEEAEKVCDRVAIVNKGSLVALEAPRKLLQAIGERVVELQFNGTKPSFEEVRASVPMASRILLTGNRATIPVTGDAAAARRLMEEAQASTLPLVGVGVRQSTLNDVFLQLTDGRAQAR
jgi:ABC-2 type transport system ATP-binding protein